MNDLYDAAWLYDLQHDGYRDDHGFYRRLAQDQAGPVLEIGAGTGRLSVALAEAGFDVVALEPNGAMRERAASRLARLAERRPDVARRVQVVDGDARTLAMQRRFALIVAGFNTLMHLEHFDDQDAALRAARAHLVPGGAFACDVFVPRFGPQGVVRAESAWSALAGPDADLFVWQHHDPVAQVVVSHHRLDRRDGPHVTRHAATLRQRYFQRLELERALRAAGFADVRCYGDFERGPVREASAVWAYVARG